MAPLLAPRGGKNLGKELELSQVLGDLGAADLINLPLSSWHKKRVGRGHPLTETALSPGVKRGLGGSPAGQGPASPFTLPAALHNAIGHTSQRDGGGTDEGLLGRGIYCTWILPSVDKVWRLLCKEFTSQGFGKEGLHPAFSASRDPLGSPGPRGPFPQEGPGKAVPEQPPKRREGENHSAILSTWKTLKKVTLRINLMVVQYPLLFAEGRR